MTRIAVIGLGEAGGLYARGLRQAGADVVGYDPFVRLDDAGIMQVDALAEAVHDADVALSLVWASAAAEVAAQVGAVASRPLLFADMNTAARWVKTEIAAAAAARGMTMADVAVLAPVPRAGHRTALLASGAGAAALAELLAPLGVPITVMTGGAGAAAELKLLRSVFMKGLAALTIESLGAARAAGAESWLRDQIAAEFGGDGVALVDRLLEGTYRHAVRREAEVRDALAEVEASGHPADMTRATLAWFERIVAGEASPPGRGESRA